MGKIRVSFRRVGTLALFAALAAPDGLEAARVERERYLMGTRLHLTLEGEAEGVSDGGVRGEGALQAAATRAFEEVARLEGLLSNWRQDSEVSNLNRLAAAGTVPVSEDLYAVLRAGERLADRTGGAFDPTVEPLVRAYDLRGAGRIPPDAERERAASLIGCRRVRLDDAGRAARFDREGMGVDLGGIGKGYALDRAAALLRGEGVTRALLDFGGQFLAIGAPPGEEGWKIGLADPGDRSRVVASILLRDGSVGTSGQSERSVEAGGRVLGHILDPRSGEPAPAWGGVTVVAASATEADALSTALFVLGPEAGRAWMAEHAGAAAVFAVASGGETPPDLSLAGSSPALLAFAVEPPRSAGSAEDAGAADNAPDAASGAPDAAGAPDHAELARRIDILAEEVEGMKLGEVAGATTSEHGLGPAASKVYHVPAGVSIGGYGEVLYENFAAEREDGAASGRRDRLDYLRSIVYLGYKFSDRLLFNSELEFEHANTEHHGAVSVEFGYVDFLLRPALNARAGMVLVPVGLVNELHEPPVFFGARRPDVERSILPTTWRANGAGLFGEPATGWHYRAYVLESLKAVPDEDAGVAGFGAGGVRGGRQSGSESALEDVAVAGRLEWSWPAGVLAGASVFSGNAGQGAEDPSGEAIGARTAVYEAHLQLRRRGFHARALYAGVSVGDAARLNETIGLDGNASIGKGQAGWYVEGAFDLLARLAPGSGLGLSPYVRWERLNTQKEVPRGFAADPGNDRRILTVGAAFHPHPQVVLKTDWQRHSNGAKSGVDQVNAALGFLF